MEHAEISQWFDKAVKYMRDGDFLSAATCLQRVIDESSDLHARHVALRNLHWWCIPLDLMVKKLRAMPGPVTLEELLSEVSGLQTSPEFDYARYTREVTNELTQVATVRRLDDRVWIHRDHLEAGIELLIGQLYSKQSPATLSDLVNDLLDVVGGASLSAGPQVLAVLKTEIAKKKGIVLLEENCVFDEAGLEHFLAELLRSIERSHKPVQLSTVVDAMAWPPSVKADLRIDALRLWLHSYAGVHLVEVADGWWYIDNVVDFSDPSLAYVFTDRPGVLHTETIIRLSLFGDSQDPEQLQENYYRAQSKRLAHNPSLIAIGSDLWLLKEEASHLVDRVIDLLAQSDRPRSLHELIGVILPTGSKRIPFLHELQAFLASRLTRDDRVTEASEGAWVHRATIQCIVDRAYDLLQDSVPRSSLELLKECLGVPMSSRQCKTSFRELFELALRYDGRFTMDHTLNVWTAIPPGNRNNNAAYLVLYQERRPLSRQQIVEIAKHIPHAKGLMFQLDSDDRFKQTTDGKWMLARWIQINDLAAAYLAQSPIPLLASTIKQRVCEIHYINQSDAIFDPANDARFVSAPLNKWTCRSPGKLLSPELLNELVHAISEATHGVTLEEVVMRTLRDPPSAFHNLEQTLLADGRLINCDGLWYSKAKSFYWVTTEDLAKVKSYIARIGYPAPASVLAETCLGKQVCLTDLEAKLAEAAEFVFLGSAGWVVRGLQPETVGRQRQVNFPIRSGKYIPTINPELLVVSEDAGIEPSNLTERTDRHKRESRVRHLTVALSFEDVRDGSLVVTSSLRRLLGQSIHLAAIRVNDELGNSTSCWHDSTNSLLHGLGQWFSVRRLTFGDKIRISSTEKDDEFYIQPTGDRNEQVYLEGIRRSHVQNLLDEARRVNRSYHDLALEVLEYFELPLQIDDLWAMVNYRRTAKKSTLSAILSSRPYFVSQGGGYWRFNTEEYVKMIRDLEQRVRKLEADNQQLRAETQALSHGALETSTLRKDLEQAHINLRLAQEALRRSEDESAKLKSELESLRTTMQEATSKDETLRAELEQWAALSHELETKLHIRTTELEEANRQLLTDLTASKAQLASLCTTEPQFKKQISELQAALQQAREDVAKANERNLGLQRDIDETLVEKQELNRRAAQLTGEHEELRIKFEQSIAALGFQEAQLKAMSERESQQNDQIADLRATLQQVINELDAAKLCGQDPTSRLSPVEAEKVDLFTQLTNLINDYQALRTEFTKAMTILDSWSGKVAIKLAKRRGLEQPFWPANTPR